MKKQPERTAQTKAALSDAFWSLYRVKPIEKITVKEVADGAGVYRSTFYLYFNSIYDILAEIEADVLDEWEGMFKENFLNGTGGSSDIVSIAASFFETKGEYLAVLLSPAGDPSFAQNIKDNLRQKGYSLLKIEDNTEIRLIYEFFLSGILGLLSRWFREGKPISAVQAATLSRRMMSENIIDIVREHSAVQFSL
ncbi:MAG: TetR/AcrR family transcriptional regulator [Peptococcaceae bacterium]|nr:TetR/AcrR family transcriptional regulator [Peptococcaceae bacterium]